MVTTTDIMCTRSIGREKHWAIGTPAQHHEGVASRGNNGGCWRHAKARRIFQPLIQWMVQGAGQSVSCLGGRWGGVASVRASAIEPCRRDGSAGNYMDREHSARPEGNDAARYPCIPDGSKIGPWNGRSLTAHPNFWEEPPGSVGRPELGIGKPIPSRSVGLRIGKMHVCRAQHYLSILLHELYQWCGGSCNTTTLWNGARTGCFCRIVSRISGLVAVRAELDCHLFFVLGRKARTGPPLIGLEEMGDLRSLAVYAATRPP